MPRHAQDVAVAAIQRVILSIDAHGEADVVRATRRIHQRRADDDGLVAEGGPTVERVGAHVATWRREARDLAPAGIGAIRRAVAWSVKRERARHLLAKLSALLEDVAVVRSRIERLGPRDAERLEERQHRPVALGSDVALDDLGHSLPVVEATWRNLAPRAPLRTQQPHRLGGG